MNPRFMAPPKTPHEAVESRRNPCYGFVILADIQNNTALLDLLTETRDAIIEIAGPKLAIDQDDKIITKYKKQKFFHAAVFSIPPLLDKKDYVTLYENKNGILDDGQINQMCHTLQNHAKDLQPYLQPLQFEIMPDGTILARLEYKTIDDSDATPLLTLNKTLDQNEKFPKWDASNVARFKTVTIVLAALDKNVMSAEQLDAMKAVLNLKSPILKQIGNIPVQEFFLSTYDQRTLSLKHLSMYAAVKPNSFNRI